MPQLWRLDHAGVLHELRDVGQPLHRGREVERQWRMVPMGGRSVSQSIVIELSLDQAVVPRGVNPSGLNFDYTATKSGVYWVNNGVTGGTYPDGASYGILSVFKVENNIMQLFSYEMGLWHRMNVNDRWCPWQKLN